MDLPEKLAADGFAIIPRLIPQELIAGFVEAVLERVRNALTGYNLRPGKDFKGLMEAVPQLDKTPDGWTGSRFGSRQRRGWMKSSGTGRIFDDWHEPCVVAVQEACRGLAAALHRVPPESLHRVHERCSIKVPGCPEFEAHIDRSRENTFQILIPMTDTKVLVWPGSHAHQIAVDERGFYSLKPSDIEALPQPRSEVDVAAGDVCVMVGGRLVHGSVAVTSGMRIMTYAHYEAPSTKLTKKVLRSKTRKAKQK